ncbi:DedA family protein [Citrobacter amalonaticus]|uniref:DedA family protein n=1 Tax=Citrobacter amalonaticus TaxID=35703 RepID=A0A2S4S2F6_CITAM|nr:VTT domain-containing protein [Citrobacter amalonaticus]POT59466.1 DedA family protein [Citrobacter amalonaticus]POT77596.1 DedA family protein [Citrobacter amalonaticus]POU68048.1 DedA family protein [Citrobacter amalonaticus]POV07652.1 DedA family protein [Citrobacter amalonaticus]
MEWINALMDHFALHPVSLGALLFAIAFTKSTFLISSLLPPASVMLIAGISLSQATLPSWVTGGAIMAGAWSGSIVSYHLGMMMAHIPWLGRAMSRHADNMVRIRRRLHNGAVPVLFTSRFIAVLRYIVPLVAGMLRLRLAMVYSVSLLSAGAWSVLYVGGLRLVVPLFS